MSQVATITIQVTPPTRPSRGARLFGALLARRCRSLEAIDRKWYPVGLVMCGTGTPLSLRVGLALKVLRGRR